MSHSEQLDLKIRNFFSDVVVSFKRTKQKAEEAFGNVERTKFDPEIETQWWMLLAAQTEMKEIKSALETLMQPNPAFRMEKALLNTIDVDNVITDFFDRPVESSNFKDLSISLYKAASELEGITTVTNVLRSVAETEKEISKYEHQFRQTTNALVLAQINDFLGTAEGVIRERKKIENIRLDLDVSKTRLRSVLTLEERNLENQSVIINQDKFDDAQAIFKGLLSSAINSLNDQQEAWKTFLESQRDFLTCSATKTDQMCSLYTDHYSSPLQTSLEEASTSSTSQHHDQSEEFEILNTESNRVSSTLGMTVEEPTVFPISVPPDDLGDLKPHVIDEARADLRKESSIKKLSKIFSFLPGMKKKQESREELPVSDFVMPHGSSNEEIILNMKIEMDRMALEKKKLETKIERLTTCPICDEKYDNAGVRSAMKLKCTHIICIQCAFLWLNSKGKQATCPTCRLPYREQDVQKVQLNI